MSQVLVMTDSVACIPHELLARYDIPVLPTGEIRYNGNTYIDGETITSRQAYELLQKDPNNFSTSTMTPAYLLEILRKIRARSNRIICIMISSKLSAGCKIAGIAAQLLQEESPDTDIRIIDSKTVAGSEGLLVLAATRAARQNQSSDEIEKLIERLRTRTGGIILPETLKYAYRTGRIPKIASDIAGKLNIKPVNIVTANGNISFTGKLRNNKNSFDYIAKLIREDTNSDSLHFMINHADAPQSAAKLAEYLQKNFNCLSMIISEFSPIMGYGAGPGCLYIGYQPPLEIT